MKKRIFAILMAVIMVTSLVIGAIPAMAAEDNTITIRVHYHREDGNYEGWNMWHWDPDGISELSPPYYFEEGENGDMVSTIQVKTGTTKVGYIVRYSIPTNEWEAKDVGYDQFINLTGILSGTIDFYIESGKASQPSVDATPTVDKLIENGFMVLGDDVQRGVVIANSAYKTANRDGKPEITLQMSSPLPEEPTVDTFKVSNADKEIGIEKVRFANQYVYLVLTEPLDLTRSYNVTFEGRDYALTMPDFYSSEEFESQFTYTGNDLGATYTSDSTFLRLWAPTAVEVNVKLYSNGDPTVEKTTDRVFPMTKDVNGTWICTLDGDMNGTYYTYEVKLDTKTVEACDPYARTTGINGDRAMIIDLASTNPEGWDTDSNPNADLKYVDTVIYELHVRDLSADSSAGISNVGKYLGLIETGTKTPSGIPTGLDHMVDLGITHLHLLPVYDINSVNERVAEGQYNWGYDPKNYNVPEGSYSTDPYNGEVRVKEFKQMVKGLHDAGISVVMDVVYNHVADSGKFCVNQITPGYFSRPGANGSGCGNDTASERSMVHKYIVDSVNYWADEYHIDGFRFDLVGLLDTETINEIVETVHAKHPDVIFYGEGWTMVTKMTKPGYTMATQTNSMKTPGFAYFSDTVRNLIKGGTYGGVNKGFISGGSSNAVNMESCFKGLPDWCTTPSQSVNYISCHDNNTLFDHISIVRPEASLEDKAGMNKLGAAFILTAQGIPFFQAGEEFLRSKPDPTKPNGFNENSYSAGDGINSIKWSELDKDVYMNVYNYYKGLIAFRKAHPALRLDNADDVEANVTRINKLPANVYGYEIAGGINGEASEGIIALFNGSNETATVTLPAGNWNIYVNGELAGTEVISSVEGTVDVPAISAMVLVKEAAPVDPPVTEPSDPSDPSVEPSAPSETEPSAPEASDPSAPEASNPETTAPAETEAGKDTTTVGKAVIILLIVLAVVIVVAVVLSIPKKIK